VIETSVTADAGYLLTTQYSTDGGTNVVSDGCDAAVSTDGSTITIVNTETAGIELPSTGGHGTMGYTLAGLVLVLLAGIFLLMGRKRKVDG